MFIAPKRGLEFLSLHRNLEASSSYLPYPCRQEEGCRMGTHALAQPWGKAEAKVPGLADQKPTPPPGQQALASPYV